MIDILLFNKCNILLFSKFLHVCECIIVYGAINQLNLSFENQNAWYCKVYGVENVNAFIILKYFHNIVVYLISY